MSEPDDVPPLWDTYISVDDVEASVKIVEKLGGEIVVPPTDIPNLGRFCVIADMTCIIYQYQPNNITR